MLKQKLQVNMLHFFIEHIVNYDSLDFEAVYAVFKNAFKPSCN